MDESVERGLDWANLLVVATVARLLCQNRHRDCAHSTGYGPTPGTLSGWSYRRPTPALRGTDEYPATPRELDLPIQPVLQHVGEHLVIERELDVQDLLVRGGRLCFSLPHQTVDALEGETGGPTDMVYG